MGDRLKGCSRSLHGEFEVNGFLKSTYFFLVHSLAEIHTKMIALAIWLIISSVSVQSQCELTAVCAHLMIPNMTCSGAGGVCRF